MACKHISVKWHPKNRSLTSTPPTRIKSVALSCKEAKHFQVSAGPPWKSGPFPLFLDCVLGNLKTSAWIPVRTSPVGLPVQLIRKWNKKITVDACHLITVCSSKAACRFDPAGFLSHFFALMELIGSLFSLLGSPAKWCTE